MSPLLLMILLAQPEGPAKIAALRARVATQPPAIRELIERRAYCNHWAGEEPYDEQRRGEILDALGELGCATIEGEVIFLGRYFARWPDTTRLLDETRDLLGW